MPDETESPNDSGILAHLDSIANSELVKLSREFYGDGLKAPVHQTAKELADDLETFRYLFKPIHTLLRGGAERLNAWLAEKVVAKVPPERRQEAPAYIAGPALRSLVFMDEANPLKELFLNLLRHAIDREEVGNVHPAFVGIIEQLSPDEAMLLMILSETGGKGFILEKYPIDPRGRIQHERITCSIPETERQHLSDPLLIESFFERLLLLNLVVWDTRIEERTVSFDVPQYERRSESLFTEFGYAFISVCLPENFDDLQPSD